ncbi:DUF1003 domain-containing protein [Acidipila sp. EB88]|uniref:DUF1003 domain-containing protein n=1 Tax=Acidipila sp. EB88 TaxID=2305226 RepID=UPI000F5FEDD1|nr:DUF1003 domain-containing protein [Acidipila sp. EB88]RRA48067.1 DUF1003 domain-containing protein [Acidipila sp. EB88]
MGLENKEKVSGSVERNIRSIAEMEQHREASKSGLDRLAASIGTLFGTKLAIGLHVVWYGSWLLINTHRITGVPAFDPRPFPILSLCVSIEAVMLTIFVLLKQNHMQGATDHRDHLNLQIDLLTEKELTKALQLLRAVCVKLEISEAVNDGDLSEMSQVTSVGTLAERIMTDLPSRR